MAGRNMARHRTVDPCTIFRGSIGRRHLAAALVAAVVIGSAAAVAQEPPTSRPPLLFKEEWRLAPHDGPATDENQRFTPAIVTNEHLEVTILGPSAAVVRAAEHERRVDLWNGLATSPIAVMLRDKRNFVDLTGLARLRWMVRTNSIHTLYPVVKLADGTYIIGNRGISTDGEFLQVEIAFSGMRWFRLEPTKVVATTEVRSPALNKVDEVGLATLAPGGGHGFTASANLSTVELFANGIPR